MQSLSAKLRVELGKKVRALRGAGFLPAVVYGEGTKSKAIAVSMRDFEKVHREAGETGLVTLNVEGQKPLNVMIHDIAHDALTGKPIHADFYSVRMDKEIERRVPFVFTGEPPAVKNEGGILVKVMHEVEVKALPKDLPHELTVDISELGAIGEKIYMKDISVPKGVTVLADADDVVALVEAPRSEEELAELQAAAAPEVVEVKTEQEVKAEEKAERVAEETKTEESSRK